MSKLIDRIGKTYGRLTVLSRSYERSRKRAYYLCQCTCGNTKTVSGLSLSAGQTKSCGCLRREITIARFCTHGESNGPDFAGTKEYRTWAQIKARCLNKSHKKYPVYGGRGIQICDRWIESYQNFLSDMGRAPSEQHSIERDNVNGNYEPSNCRWATNEEQCLNKQNTLWISIDGVDKPLKTVCKSVGLNYYTVRQRLRAGWPIDRCLSEPDPKGGQFIKGSNKNPYKKQI